MKLMIGEIRTSLLIINTKIPKNEREIKKFPTPIKDKKAKTIEKEDLLK